MQVAQLSGDLQQPLQDVNVVIDALHGVTLLVVQKVTQAATLQAPERGLRPSPRWGPTQGAAVCFVLSVLCAESWQCEQGAQWHPA